MATNEITGARYLAEALKHLGVTHVFFMDAILRRSLVEMEQVGITCVLAHSEKAAAYMADAYARVTGRAGVVGSLGPGDGVADQHHVQCADAVIDDGPTVEGRQRPRLFVNAAAKGEDEVLRLQTRAVHQRREH
ncbi:MAG: hypothetical protein CL569_04130 [Alphaproteobacteria bacterium]|nr:hypothetical protein [Alphaproteobacteria bacterium]